MAILSESELREALAERRAWRRTGDALVRERSLKDFDQALAFAERIGAAVEDWGRHPDVAIIGGNRVRVTVTNPNGAGFTDAELRLVAKVDEVADAPVPEARTQREGLVAVAATSPVATAVTEPLEAAKELVRAEPEPAEEEQHQAPAGGRRKAVAAVLAGTLAAVAAGVVAATRRR